MSRQRHIAQVVVVSLGGSTATPEALCAAAKAHHDNLRHVLLPTCAQSAEMAHLHPMEALALKSVGNGATLAGTMLAQAALPEAWQLP
jgi:hypothetical protein